MLKSYNSRKRWRSFTVKLFDFFRRKNKAEQEETAQEEHEESVQEENKQENSVEEAKDIDKTNEADDIEQVDERNEADSEDKDSEETEEDDSEDETEDEEDEDDEGEEREHCELSFDYEQFEEDLFTTFEEFMKGYLDRKEDMYIFSVNYFPDFTTTIGVNANSYSYLNEQTESDPDLYADYKFCEEEWEVGEWFESLSEQLQVYFDQLEEEYEDEEDTHDELYEEHRDRIIDICKNVMKRIKETDTFKEYPQMLLNVYVREFFGDEEMIAIFEEINGDVVPDDYMKFMKG